MDIYDLVRLLVALIFSAIFLLWFIGRFFKKKFSFSAKLISRVAIFGSISALLYIIPYLKFSVPFFPAFLEIHFDEVPALIAGFAYGPLCGFLVIVLKTIIKLPFSSTLCVGELADLLYGSIFVVVASIVYKYKRSIKGAIFSILIATFVQLVVSSFFTTFVMLDFYIFMMGFPKQAILSMSQAANKNVSDLTWSFLLFIALPFNAFKDAIIGVVTFLLYKQSHKLIDKIADKVANE